MLQQLRSFYNTSNSTVPMKNYSQYIKELSNKSKLYINKYNEVSMSENLPFITMIKKILIKYDVEMMEIEKYRDDLDLIDFVNNIINNNSTPDQNSFFKKNTIYTRDNYSVTNEYFLLLKNRIPYKYFPMGKGLSDSTYPIRLIYSNSTEYSLHMANGRLINKFDYPDISIYAIDVSLLLFCYFKYLQITVEKKAKINVNKFITEYVFLPLIYQQQDVIFINLIQTIIEDIEFSIITESDIIITEGFGIVYDNRFNFINYNLKKAISDFAEIIPKLISGRITPSQVLNSVRLPSGISLKDNIVINDNLIKLTDDIKREWTIFLKDFYSVRFVYFLHNIYPNEQNQKAIRRLLYSKTNILKSTKFWSYIQDKELSDYVENNLMRHLEKIVLA